jgi:hypothetical protein
VSKTRVGTGCLRFEPPIEPRKIDEKPVLFCQLGPALFPTFESFILRELCRSVSPLS